MHNNRHDDVEYAEKENEFTGGVKLVPFFFLDLDEGILLFTTLGGCLGFLGKVGGNFDSKELGTNTNSFHRFGINCWTGLIQQKWFNGRQSGWEILCSQIRDRLSDASDGHRRSLDGKGMSTGDGDGEDCGEGGCYFHFDERVRNWCFLLTEKEIVCSSIRSLDFGWCVESMQTFQKRQIFWCRQNSESKDPHHHFALGFIVLIYQPVTTHHPPKISFRISTDVLSYSWAYISSFASTCMEVKCGDVRLWKASCVGCEFVNSSPPTNLPQTESKQLYVDEWMLSGKVRTGIQTNKEL